MSLPLGSPYVSSPWQYQVPRGGSLDQPLLVGLHSYMMFPFEAGDFVLFTTLSLSCLWILLASPELSKWFLLESCLPTVALYRSLLWDLIAFKEQIFPLKSQAIRRNHRGHGPFPLGNPPIFHLDRFLVPGEVPGLGFGEEFASRQRLRPRPRSDGEKTGWNNGGCELSCMPEIDLHVTWDRIFWGATVGK